MGSCHDGFRLALPSTRLTVHVEAQIESWRSDSSVEFMEKVAVGITDCGKSRLIKNKPAAENNRL
jgi:hypothetical protein